MLGIDRFGNKTLTFPELQRFSLSAVEQKLQAKPRCLSAQEMNRISEATFSMIALYGCECDRNERTLSIVSPRCLQHCDVFVGISLED